VAIAAALAIVGALVLVLFVQSAEDRALEGEEVVEVLVVQEQIPAGTPVSEIEDVVEEEKVPAKVANAGAVGDISQLAGLVAAVDLIEGDQLTAARFTTPEAFSPSRSQVEVPTGLLEITITADPERSIGGTIQPGDTIAFIASFGTEGGTTNIILNKILVTNVQGAPITTPVTNEDGTETRAAAPEGSLLVTMAVDAAAAQKIAFVSEFGTIYLAREPADAPSGQLSPEEIGTIFG
jgi:pilus assembly protein CpaB